MPTIISSHAPEPEEPKSLDEQIAEYRKSYRTTLANTATAMTLPVKKATAIFRAATV